MAVDSIFKFFSLSLSFFFTQTPLSGKVATIFIPERNYTHTRISREEEEEEEEAKRMVRDWRLSSGWLASSRGARLKREREERRAV